MEMTIKFYLQQIKVKETLIKKISRVTSTKVSIIGIISNKYISKHIKLINGKFSIT